MGKLCPFLSLCLGLIACGCTSYRPAPIAEAEILRELGEIRPEELTSTVPQSPENPIPSLFDVSDGLSTDEAVAIALALNPELRVRRGERGIAVGNVRSSQLFANPEMEIGKTGALDAGLTWQLPKIGERGANIAASHAAFGAVTERILAEESRLSLEVKKAYLTLLAAEESLRLSDAALELQERVRQYARDKYAAGDVSRLDLNLVELEYADASQERESALFERDALRLALNRLMGLPPSFAVTLQANDLLEYRPFRVEPDQLETSMLERREIAATKREIETVESRIRLAQAESRPGFVAGPAFEREDGENRFGASIGIEIPLFDRNQGEIESLMAAREQLRESLRAAIYAARAELHEAYHRLKSHERQIHRFRKTVEPVLEENARLTEAGFEMGEFDTLQTIVTQRQVIESRREFLTARMEYRKAWMDLEWAAGGTLMENGKE